MPLRELEASLKVGLKPVYAVLGDEALLVERAEQRACAAALDGVLAAFNQASARAGDEGALEALSVARTLPMMSPRRLVQLREIERAPPALMEALLAYVESPSDTAVLVISGTGWPKPEPARGEGGKGEPRDPSKALEAALKRQGLLLRFKAKDQDPVAFAMVTAQQLGCRLDRGQAERLVELVGRDLGLLERELEKACLFLGGQGVLTDAVLHDVCSLVAEAQIWDLTDGLVSRDADKALEALLRLMEAKEGGESHRLIAMVSWQFRQLITLQEAGPEAVKMPPWKLKAAQRALQAHPVAAARLLDQLVQTNQRMNSHRAGDRRVFEGLVLALLARR